MVECDLALTKVGRHSSGFCSLCLHQDHKFVCIHEPYLSRFTDISSKPEYADRLTTHVMDDDDPLMDWNDKGEITDWFTFDFTLEELMGLRVKQGSEWRNPAWDWKVLLPSCPSSSS